MSARSEPPFSERITTGTTATVISSYDLETNNSIDLGSAAETLNPSCLQKAEEHRMDNSDQIADRQVAYPNDEYNESREELNVEEFSSGEESPLMEELDRDSQRF